jgi:hypothetical protein
LETESYYIQCDFCENDLTVFFPENATGYEIERKWEQNGFHIDPAKGTIRCQDCFESENQ